jgi:hypothetical protein
MRRSPLRAFRLPALLVALVLAPPPADAQQVWSGRDFFFEKADSANPALPQNQDRITNAVWITRDDTKGIYNIAQEVGHTPLVSPVDTEWATGDAVEWPMLTFSSWGIWHSQFPPSTVGVDAVVHLISDDIYIDIRFESWTQGALGGGFSYHRATPGAVSVENLVTSASWGRVKLLFR